MPSAGQTTIGCACLHSMKTTGKGYNGPSPLSSCGPATSGHHSACDDGQAMGAPFREGSGTAAGHLEKPVPGVSGASTGVSSRTLTALRREDLAVPACC